MSKKPTLIPEQILQDHHPEVQAIAHRLQALIKSTFPEVIEKAYGGWHGIGYTHPQAGYFCCIFPRENDVRLALEFGALLPDPDHLLILPPTSSKQLRYIELPPEQAIPEVGILALLHAAVDLKS